MSMKLAPSSLFQSLLVAPVLTSLSFLKKLQISYTRWKYLPGLPWLYLGVLSDWNIVSVDSVEWLVQSVIDNVVNSESTVVFLQYLASHIGPKRVSMSCCSISSSNSLSICQNCCRHHVGKVTLRLRDATSLALDLHGESVGSCWSMCNSCSFDHWCTLVKLRPTECRLLFNRSSMAGCTFCSFWCHIAVIRPDTCHGQISQNVLVRICLLKDWAHDVAANTVKNSVCLEALNAVMCSIAGMALRGLASF